MSGEGDQGPRVHRAAAIATWEYQHKWGRDFGDSTALKVRRTDGGDLRISYGGESLTIRGELVEQVAKMVAAAAVWTDEPTGADQ